MNLIPSKNYKKSPGRRVKVFYLIGELGFGGSERQLYLLLKNMDMEHYECHVIVFNPSRHFTFHECLVKLGVRLWEISSHCRSISSRIRFLFRIFRKLKPDVVHSWTFHDNPYAGLIGWLARVPVRLGSMRGSIFSADMKTLPFICRLLCVYSVNGIVVNSRETLEELKSSPCPSPPIYVVPNCVNTDLYYDVTNHNAINLSSLGIESGHRIVGIVGNLRRVKNHLMFVESMALVLEKYPDVRGLIVGQPVEPDIPDLIFSKIRKLGLEGSVILAGFRNDVPALIKRFSVLCLTSNSEGLPNAILEAMAAARPVIATRVGGVGSVVKHGVNGLLVEPGDAGGLASAVTRLLSDQVLAERLGNAGRKMVQQEFGCQRMAHKFSHLYLNQLAHKTNRKLRNTQHRL
jgi:glycosyltransferase involved in cell wall biosynthesis